MSCQSAHRRLCCSVILGVLAVAAAAAAAKETSMASKSPSPGKEVLSSDREDAMSTDILADKL